MVRAVAGRPRSGASSPNVDASARRPAVESVGGGSSALQPAQRRRQAATTRLIELQPQGLHQSRRTGVTRACNTQSRVTTAPNPLGGTPNRFGLSPERVGAGMPERVGGVGGVGGSVPQPVGVGPNGLGVAGPMEATLGRVKVGTTGHQARFLSIQRRCGPRGHPGRVWCSGGCRYCSFNSSTPFLPT